MTEPKRLFDCLHYHLERKPLDDMLAGKEAGQWKKYSTQQVTDIVNNLSAGLLSLGIGPGDMTNEGRDKIAVLSKNRPEWIMLDLAVQQIGAVLTPFYPTINVNELEFVLNDAQVNEHNILAFKIGMRIGVDRVAFVFELGKHEEI